MIFNSNSKILIILAHPDDEVLGAGGLLLKAKSSGAKIRIVWLGEGVSARFSGNELNSKNNNDALLIRENRARNAMKIIGVDDFSFGDLYCLRFDQTPIIEITKKIEKEIKNFKPDVLITHNPIEVNADHIITFKAVKRHKAKFFNKIQLF